VHYTNVHVVVSGKCQRKQELFSTSVDTNIETLDVNNGLQLVGYMFSVSDAKLLLCVRVV